jgi:AmmeMemoRadiSam system protein B
MKKIVIFLICLALGIATILFLKNTEKTYEVKTSTGAHTLLFWEPDLFRVAVKTHENDVPYKKHITGAIVPHHLVPSVLIADIFKKISHQNPKTIIVIGPNHYELGQQKILSSKQSWQTPFGLVDPQLDIMQKLETKNLVHYDDAVLDNEHSVATMMPFVKYYAPYAKVVPIILSKSLTEKELKEFVEALNKELDTDTVVITSVDFSHYQTQAVAEKNDMHTLDIMQHREFDALLALTSAHVDSPPSIVATLMLMDARNLDFTVIQNTNSGRIQQKPYQEVTSYFTVVF